MFGSSDARDVGRVERSTETRIVETDVLESAALLSKGKVIRWTQRPVELVDARKVEPYFDQSARLRIGQRPEQHAVHDTEHGGRRGDSEGESEDSYGREPRRFAQNTEDVAQVMPACHQTGLPTARATAYPANF